MATPAKIFVTGAMGAYVKHAVDSTPSFLGHSEQAPHISEDAHYNDVICDVAGSVPIDKVYAGIGAVITMTLIRFGQDALNVITTRGRSAAVGNITPGYDAPGARGSLAVGERSYFTLYLVHANYSKAAFQGMPQGYCFPCCVLGNQGVQGGSVNARKVTVTVMAINLYDPTVQTAQGFGAHTLWTSDVTPVLSIPPV